MAVAVIIKQPSPRRAAYCIPHGPPPPPPPPPPQFFVFKIATNLSTSASSYFTYNSHHIPLGNCFGDILISIIIINPLITMATNEEKLVSAFQEKISIRSSFNLAICSAMSANDLINFWEQTIKKWPFSGYFEF